MPVNFLAEISANNLVNFRQYVVRQFPSLCGGIIRQKLFNKILYFCGKIFRQEVLQFYFNIIIIYF
jgi:hypothetical protein